MPKRLPARWQPESIREFRASARWRFDEGMALAAAGYRTGAIYLLGILCGNDPENGLLLPAWTGGDSFAHLGWRHLTRHQLWPGYGNRLAGIGTGP